MDRKIDQKIQQQSKRNQALKILVNLIFILAAFFLTPQLQRFDNLETIDKKVVAIFADLLISSQDLAITIHFKEEPFPPSMVQL